MAALCLVFVMCILLYAGVFDRVPEGQINADALAAGEPLTFTGQVYQRASEKLYVQCVHIISSAGELSSAIPCKDNLICILEQGTDIPLGSAVKLTGTFRPFPAATNPGEFDLREYYRSLGIGGRVSGAVVLAQGESFWRLRESMHQLRALLKRRLGQVLREREAAVMCALLLGDREGLDPELKDLYQRNGILHILSISSLHITMIGMTVYRLLRRCRLPVCPAATAGCGLLLLYGMMTGFSVSACRAVGMYALRMTAEMAGRTYDMPTATGVTAAALVMGNPFCLRQSGFLLSFTSLAGIGVVYPVLRNACRREGAGRGADSLPKVRERLSAVAGRLEDAFLSGVSITLATLPVQLWFFYQVPGYSVLLNMLVLPSVKLLMAAGFLALIPGLGIFGWAAWLILRGYEELCSLFDMLPFHTWNPGKPRPWQAAAYYLALAAALWAVGRLRDRGTGGEKHLRDRGAGREKRLRDRGTGGEKRLRDRGTGGEKRLQGCRAGTVACFAALSLAPVIFAWKPAPVNQILFLDVGQGDGILVRTASGENYLFDCGSSSRSQIGKYVLLPCLRYYGIQAIDAVILSHPDADHVNGALELLAMGQDSGVRIRQLVLPELSEAGKAEMLEQLAQYLPREGPDLRIPTGYLSAGESFCCDRAEFLCLHPRDGWESGEANACSVCVYGVFNNKDGEKEFDFLLTGDVEGYGEDALLAQLRDRDIRGVSLLKAAHHGSKNSTSEELLEQIAPALSVISCGRNNRYGHPHRELLERLDGAGSDTVITSETGAFRVYLDKRGRLRVEAAR